MRSEAYTWMAFGDIINQELAKKILTSALREDRISHSYLFHGPQGSGKKQTALEFAKALNCSQRRGDDPCENCPSCRRIASHTHPDVQLTSPIGPKQVIGIQAIKKIEKYAALKSMQSRYEVFIIDQAERLTKEAGNSFLKTLEEPPPEVVIILISAFPDEIIPTIVSRCQKVKFVSLSPSEGVEMVKNRFDLDERRAHLLYFICGGRMNRIDLWLRAELWSLREKICEFVETISSSDYEKPLAMAEVIYKRVQSFTDDARRQKEDSIRELEDNLPSFQIKNIKAERQAEVQDEVKELIRIIFSILKSLYRDLWAIRNGREFIINTDREQLLRQRAEKLTSSYVIQATEEIERQESFLAQSANVSLALQVLFINLFSGRIS